MAARQVDCNVQWRRMVPLAVVLVAVVAIHLDPTPPDVPLPTKLVHAAAFYTLALTLWVALPLPYVGQRMYVVFAIGAVTAMCLEALQSLVPTRHPDPFDVLADLVGLLGALIPLGLGSEDRSTA